MQKKQVDNRFEYNVSVYLTTKKRLSLCYKNVNKSAPSHKYLSRWIFIMHFNKLVSFLDIDASDRYKFLLLIYSRLLRCLGVTMTKHS